MAKQEFYWKILTHKVWINILLGSVWIVEWAGLRGQCSQYLHEERSSCLRHLAFSSIKWKFLSPMLSLLFGGNNRLLFWSQFSFVGWGSSVTSGHVFSCLGVKPSSSWRLVSSWVRWAPSSAGGSAPPCLEGRPGSAWDSVSLWRKATHAARGRPVSKQCMLLALPCSSTGTGCDCCRLVLARQRITERSTCAQAA